MKNPEKLIGKKVKGFKFDYSKECSYNNNMDSYIGKVGIIHSKNRDYECYSVLFDNAKKEWSYPADQIEAHLVEDEIPTLTDGVMMLVSDDNKTWYEREVVLKSNEGFYVKGLITSSLVFWKYAKPIEPTKEEQLTAILGSDEKVSEIMELFKNE